MHHGPMQVPLRQQDGLFQATNSVLVASLFLSDRLVAVIACTHHHLRLVRHPEVSQLAGEVIHVHNSTFIAHEALFLPLAVWWRVVGGKHEQEEARRAIAQLFTKYR